MRPLKTVRSLACDSVRMGVGIHAIELYVPSVAVSTAALESEHGLCTGGYTRGTLLSRICRTGPNEDAISMALTAMHRLISDAAIEPNAIGYLRVASQSLADRSKSATSEMMALGICADVEGIDETGALCGSMALARCVAWVQGASWDGRYAVVTCTDDPSMLNLAGSAAVAALVGPNAPLRLERSHAAQIPRPLQLSTPGYTPLFELQERHAAHETLPYSLSSLDFEEHCASSLVHSSAIGVLHTTSELAGLCSLLLGRKALRFGNRIACAANLVGIIQGSVRVYAQPTKEQKCLDVRGFLALCGLPKGAQSKRLLQPVPVAETFLLSHYTHDGRREYSLQLASLRRSCLVLLRRR